MCYVCDRDAGVAEVQAGQNVWASSTERLSRHRKVHSVADRLEAHSPSVEKATVYHTVQEEEDVTDLVG